MFQTENEVVFDKKYLTIITYPYNSQYYEILQWLDENTLGTVEVKPKLSDNKISAICIGFTNKNDAFLFKIKYPIK